MLFIFQNSFAHLGTLRRKLVSQQQQQQQQQQHSLVKLIFSLFLFSLVFNTVSLHYDVVIHLVMFTRKVI